MKKLLLFYWYVPETYWHPVFDLHLKNLARYKNIFDYIVFIISHDGNLDAAYKTVESIEFFIPNAKFSFMINDKESQESKFFCDEFIPELGSVPENLAVFYGHNKGVNTTYVSVSERNDWINALYFFNLYDQDKIDSLLSDEDVCAIGTGKIDNYAPPAFEKWLTYKWMFSGTFFWIVPHRLDEYIKKNNIEIKTTVGKYYIEGFLGTIFPDNAKEVRQIGANKVLTESWGDFISRNLTNDTFNKYRDAHGPLKSSYNIDIFIFTHKQFETQRMHPVYKIVCSSDCDVHSDKLGLIKFDCELSNVGFSEWQKIYEIYKKRSQLLKDYIGFAHFHRYLELSPDVNYVPFSRFPKIFEEYDILTKEPINVVNLREQYAVCHNVKDFDIMMDVIKTDFPDWYETAIECNEKGLIFDSNIMILKRDDFFRLCDFVFPVLFEYCERAGIDRTSDESFIEHVNSNEGYDTVHKPNDKFNEQARICSYLAERLVVMFMTRYTPRIKTLKMVGE